MTFFQFAAENAALTFILAIVGCATAHAMLNTALDNLRVMVRGYPPAHCITDATVSSDARTDEPSR